MAENSSKLPAHMADVQNHPADVPFPIDRVGVRGLRLPLVVSDRRNGAQHTVAQVDLGVDLPSRFKGTHMSRFVEALEDWNEELSYQSLKKLLVDVKKRLAAKKAYVGFAFPYFIRKYAPVSRISGFMAYACRLTGELEEEKPRMLLEVTVPVLTVCPCSKAVSAEGAHSQRADVHLAVRMNGFCWIEECIDMVEAGGSFPVFPVLKREDEKFVTEAAFANPVFVEDVARRVARRLEKHPRIAWYRVDVESQESIHSHNAFASIERGKKNL